MSDFDLNLITLHSLSDLVNAGGVNQGMHVFMDAFGRDNFMIVSSYFTAYCYLNTAQNIFLLAPGYLPVGLTIDTPLSQFPTPANPPISLPAGPTPPPPPAPAALVNLDLTTTVLGVLLNVVNSMSTPSQNPSDLEREFNKRYDAISSRLATNYLLEYCTFDSSLSMYPFPWYHSVASRVLGFQQWVSFLSTYPSPPDAFVPQAAQKSIMYVSNAVHAQGSSFEFQPGVVITGAPANINADGLVQYGLYQSKTTDLQSQISAIVNDGATLSNFQALQQYVDALGAADQANLAAAVGSLTAQFDQKAITEYHLLPQPAVYADGLSPIPQPAAVLTGAFDGWYAKNVVAGTKYNLYFQVPHGLTYGQLVGMVANVKLLSTASAPFISIYSVKKASGNSGSWYSQRETWDISSSAAPATGITSLVAPLTGATTFVNNPLKNTLYSYEKASSPFSTGAIAASDAILAIAFSTNSGAKAADVEFILQSFVMTTTNGTIEYTFSNSDVQQLADESTISANKSALDSAIASTNATVSANNSTITSSLATTNATVATNYDTLLSRLDKLYQFVLSTDSTVAPTR